MIGDKPERMKTERNREIAEMRNAGATYKAIGERFGICKERVRQILWREKILEKRQRGRI